MRNSTIYGTNDLVDRFMSTLRTLAPLGVENRVEPPLFAADSEWDARLAWIVDRKKTDLALEVRLSASSINVGDLPQALPGGSSVLLAPFIAPRVQTALADSGWSFWDTTGNLLLRLDKPFVWVSRTGSTRNPDPVTAPSTSLRSLKGKTASEVMVGLLADDGRTTSIRDFSRTTGLPVASVSRVVTLLREENFLEPTGGGPLVLTDRLEAARRWADDYSFTKTFNAKRYFSVLGSENALDRIAQSGVPHAVTGARAAADWFETHDLVPALRSSELWVFTSDLAALERTADLVPDAREGTVLVAEVDFLEREHTNHGGPGRPAYATPWRIVGDLLSARGRLSALGEDLGRDLMAR